MQLLVLSASAVLFAFSVHEVSAGCGGGGGGGGGGGATSAPAPAPGQNPPGVGFDASAPSPADSRKAQFLQRMKARFGQQRVNNFLSRNSRRRGGRRSSRRAKGKNQMLEEALRRWSGYWAGPDLGQVVRLGNECHALIRGGRCSGAMSEKRVGSSAPSIPSSASSAELSLASVLPGDPKDHLLTATKFPLALRQVRRLQASWTCVKKHFGGGFAKALVAEMLDRRPQLLAHFGLSNASLPMALHDQRLLRHGAVMVDTVDMVLADLSTNNGVLAGHLTTFGAQHCWYTKDPEPMPSASTGGLGQAPLPPSGASGGLEPEGWLAFGQALLSLVAVVPAPRRVRWKLLRLWRRLLHFFLACVLLGAAQSLEKELGPAAKTRSTKIRPKRKSMAFPASRRGSMAARESGPPPLPSRSSMAGLVSGTGPGFRKDGTPRIETQLLGVMLLNVPVRV